MQPKLISSNKLLLNFLIDFAVTNPYPQPNLELTYEVLLSFPGSATFFEELMSMLAILRRSAFSVVLTLPLMAASSSLAFGQAQSIDGSIRGIVTDATGTPIAGASVTIRNIDTGYVREVKPTMRVSTWHPLCRSAHTPSRHPSRDLRRSLRPVSTLAPAQI